MAGCSRGCLAAWDPNGCCGRNGGWRETRTPRTRITDPVKAKVEIMKKLLAAIAIQLLASTPFAQQKDDKLATFFMGRVKYSANDGNDCGNVGKDLMNLVSKASTLKIQDERRVKLTDPELY